MYKRKRSIVTREKFRDNLGDGLKDRLKIREFKHARF